MLGSQLCTYASLTSPELAPWAELLAPGEPPQRKVWEWAFIAAALQERGMLEAGRTGIGFGVGAEPLVSAFADRGVWIMATDQSAETARGWQASGQFAGAASALFDERLVSRVVFDDRVHYRTVDMRHIPADLGQFDFVWSSCAFEHLGSLQAGIDFVLDSVDLLIPGGVAVHTTEFNMTSDDKTLEAPNLVLYRRSDVLSLVRELERLDCRVAPLDLSISSDPHDQFVAQPPYLEPHLRLSIGGFTATSLALVIERP